MPNSHVNEGSSLLPFTPKGPDGDTSKQNEEIEGELKRICTEMFNELKAHVTGVPIPLLAASAIFAVIGLTSWNCNYNDAVPQLVQHFKEAFGIEIDSKLSEAIVEAARIGAGVGGAGGNAVLNYFGTRSLKARWETIKTSFKEGCYGYLTAYIAIGLSAGLAATSNGYVVAESADTLTKQIILFLLNSSAVAGQHMMFAIPFIGIILRSPAGDIGHHVTEALSKLQAKICGKTHVDKEYVPSAVFNICRRLIVRTGYALASLEGDSDSSRIEKQIETVTSVLATLSAALVESGDDNPFCNYPTRSHTQTSTKYLLKLNEFVSKLTLDQQALFFLRVAQELNVKPESDIEGIFLTVANTVSLPISVVSCLANLTSINATFQDFAGLFTSNPTAIKVIGKSTTGIAMWSKDAMYWNSLLSVIERVFLLPKTLTWLWQSSTLVKALIPTSGMSALITGILSGSCYAYDFLNLFPNILGGYLLDFVNLFGEQGSLIAITSFILIGLVLGAGAVNGNALSAAVSDIVLSVIHIFQPEQKANDALCQQAIAIANKMISNMVPSSKEGKAVENMMSAEYPEILRKQQKAERQSQAEFTYPKESWTRWAGRMATFGVCCKRQPLSDLPPGYTGSMPVMGRTSIST